MSSVPRLVPVTDYVPVLAPLTPDLSNGLAVNGPAYLALSRDFAVLVRPHQGAPLAPAELAREGLSMRQAWDSAAFTLLRSQRDPDRIAFEVRSSASALGAQAPRGLELKADAFPPASWLAHPKTFRVMHHHFEAVLAPVWELVYVTRDFSELFVFDAALSAVQEVLPDSYAMMYSAGFPLQHRSLKLTRV